MMRTQRSHVFFGGGVNQRLWDRTVWLLKSIRRALEGFLGMRLFVICGLVIQLVLGIPIGGPLSGAILHTVLSDLDFQSDKVFSGVGGPWPQVGTWMTASWHPKSAAAFVLGAWSIRYTAPL